MILLTGATGTTGQETVSQLLKKGVPFRVMTRDIARAKTILGPDLDYVVGDFAAPETLATAFDGVTRLSLLCAFAEKMVSLELNAVAAAKRAGITHIVKMSVIGSRAGRSCCHPDTGLQARKKERWPNLSVRSQRRILTSLLVPIPGMMVRTTRV